MTETVLVVAAHPDDEVLGCGGTIARHAAAGDRVHIVIVAEGATARHATRDADAREKEIAALREAARAAARVLGAVDVRFLRLPDNRLDAVPLLDVIKPVEAIGAALRPTIVYTHHGGDLNVDHRIVHQTTVTAFRPLPGSNVRRLLAFETVSSTEWSNPAVGAPFLPTSYVNIADHLAAKLDALRCYASEMRPFPHARSLESVEHLARMRGASVGLPAAEAFMTVREVLE